ncbi:MAG: 50S ribosomal protein L24 [Actinomycetota bacterium]
MAAIRRNDRVQVLAGKDAGRQGRVVRIFPDKNKVLVEGINRVKRHEKIRPARGRSGQSGGIIIKELPVDLSNVALVCKTDGPTRIGFRTEADGTKVRVCKKCEAEL